MGNFSAKVDKFIEIFIDQNGYVKVVQGLQNTVLIAIVGLVIGILIDCYRDGKGAAEI